MEIYLSLLLLPLLWEAARRGGERSGRTAAMLIWVCLTLFIGLRREVGGDWDNYLIMFQRGHRYPLETALALGDSGYMLAGRVLAGLGLGVGALNLLCAGIFAGGLVLFSARQRRPGLALLIATPVLIMILAMGGTRQSAAIGLVMMALALWRRDGWRLPAALMILAVFFHWSAILLLPLVPLMLLRRPLPLVVGLGAGVLLGGLLVALAQLPLAAASVEVSNVAGGALLRLLPSLAALVSLILLWRRWSASVGERNALVGWAALVVTIACAMPVIPTLADRIGFYAVVGQMVVLSRVPDLLPGVKLKQAAVGAIALAYVLLLCGWLALSPYRACWTPYRSYLASPGDLLVPDAVEPVRRSGPCEAIQL